MTKLPANWEEKKLKEICNVRSGQGAPQGEEYFTNGLVPFVRASDLSLCNSKYVGSNCSKVNAKGIDEYNLQLFKKDSVVFPKSGMSCLTGNIAILNQDSYVVNHLAVIEPIQVHSKFVFYFLKKIGVRALIKNMAYPSIKLSELENVRVMLPSLEIQKKIVAFLEKAESLVRLREETDELTDEYLKAVFYEMFGDLDTNPKGWKVDKFSNFAEIERYGILANQIPPNAIYLGLEHIEKNTGQILTDISTDSAELKSTKFRFSKEHVLYGKLRPYLNKVAQPSFDGVCSTDILPIKPIAKRANKFFIRYLMQSAYFIQYASNRASGANLPRVSPKDIDLFMAPLPPFELQQKFAQIVEKVELVKQKQCEVKKYAEEMFDSLMQSAFNGEMIC